MANATVTSKGQITLPKPVRDVLGVDAGDRVIFRVRDDGVVEVTAAKIELSSLRGALVPRVRGVSVEDMQRAIEKAATKR